MKPKSGMGMGIRLILCLIYINEVSSEKNKYQNKGQRLYHGPCLIP